MNTRVRSLAVAISLASSFACAPSSPVKRSIALDAVADVRGMALHNGNVVVVDGTGITELDKNGKAVLSHKAGEHGLAISNYRDIAALDDGTFVLIENNQGTVYDPASETQLLRFCVEPGGDFGGTPVGPVLEQKNDALAISGNAILANPRFYDGSALQSSTLRTYRLDNGEPQSDVAVDVELDGLAVGVDALYGVHDSTVEMFTSAGEHQDTRTLVDTQAAQGVAVDDAARELYVLDASRVNVYALDSLL